MSRGLIAYDGTIMPLKKIHCTAQVTKGFGLYSLTQHYYNETDTPLSVRYVFPLPAGGVVTEFSVVIGGKKITSKVIDKATARKLAQSRQGISMISTRSCGAIEFYLGIARPGERIIVKIQYLAHVHIEDNRTRLVIPTVIAPRYVPYGKQLAIESVVGKAGCRVSLDMIYRGKDIAGVESPTHSIAADIDSCGAKISFAGDEYADRDIIIDITFRGKNRPIMYHCNNIAYYSFIPKIDIYEHIPREYCFILDTSDSMRGEKLKQAKTALLICLRCLQKGDTFNIIAFNTYYKCFSGEPVQYGEASLAQAKVWLGSLSAEGGTELMAPVKAVCEREGASVLVFTDGQIANSGDISSFALKNCRCTFYTFGIDTAVNADFLTKLAELTGGWARFITPSERIDESIVRAFNKIAAPSIKNARISFDAVAANIIPGQLKQIHAGQPVTVTAEFNGSPPKSLTLTGELKNARCVMEVNFEHPSIAGGELLYYYAREKINRLSLMLTGEELRDDLIKKEICALSVKHGILSDETAFILTFGNDDKENTVDIVIPSSFPPVREAPAGYMRETAKKKNKTDDFFALMQKQRSNGSFVRPRVKTSLHTANILHYMCAECDKADLFVWQLRKAAEFLLSDIQKSNNAQIPDAILDALETWYKKFDGKNDRISQKIAALMYLYRKN